MRPEAQKIRQHIDYKRADTAGAAMRRPLGRRRERGADGGAHFGFLIAKLH
jgi:hypothetical protein